LHEATKAGRATQGRTFQEAEHAHFGGS
jgi:hypothetical protein